MEQDLDMSVLLGRNFVKIKKGVDNDSIVFKCSDGDSFEMLHYQDCCENVTIEDIVGDLDDLLNSPILRADVATSGENPEGIKKDYQGSFTWTFYHLATFKGHVTIRWYGESNGWYSEGVSLRKINN